MPPKVKIQTSQSSVGQEERKASLNAAEASALRGGPSTASKGPVRKSGDAAEKRKTNNGSDKHKNRPKRPQIKGSDKLRVRLPPVEDFMKDLEFPAEGPSRVIMRLERLMGSDKIKLLDRTYMKTLLKRLEEGELEVWDFRSRVRKAQERERYRQLAIHGFMEPTSDMKDVYCHPLYRVNKILKRLNKFDPHNVLNPRGRKNLPPISKVDPFLDDESGAAFKNYPGHEPVDVESLSDLGSRFYLYQELNGSIVSDQEIKKKPKPYNVGDEVLSEEEDSKVETQVLYSEKEWKEPETSQTTETSTANGSSSSSSSSSSYASAVEPKATETLGGVAEPEGAQATDVEEGEEGDAEDEEEQDEEEEEDPLAAYQALELSYTESLKALQERYEIPDDANLEILWKPFQAKLIENYFGMEETVNELYDMGDEIVGVYKREILVAEDACLQLNKAIDQFELANYNAKEVS